MDFLLKKFREWIDAMIAGVIGWDCCSDVPSAFEEQDIEVVPMLYYGEGASLTSTVPIDGVTAAAPMDERSTEFYGGGPYWIGESVTRGAAVALSGVLEIPLYSIDGSLIVDAGEHPVGL